jgi:hydroxymethylpyrimidine pyrophosphatase-like HAD family hydrolase
MSNTVPKVIFCDIDGTLLEHTGDVIRNYMIAGASYLKNVPETIKQWDKLNYKIILTTGRKESVRKQTEQQLADNGIVYDTLLMGIPNGDRVLINDRKTRGIRNTAYALNLVRNSGFENVDLNSINVTVPDNCLFSRIEKPWGYEELVECNDKYVVKKLFMKKGHSCSIQYHELKTETITVLTGSLNIYVGDTLENLQLKVYSPGDTITIKPYTVHRMEASIGDCLYIETSTNELWDVVRLKDNYNRL